MTDYSKTTNILTVSGTKEADISSPGKAIRAKCLDCSGGSSDNVKTCPVTSCPLYPFRLGSNPFRKKKEYTEEQKQQMAERLKIARENKG